MTCLKLRYILERLLSARHISLYSSSVCSLVNKIVPSDSKTLSSKTWSMVLPYMMLLVPEELLAIMPPIVARLLVAGSGEKCRQ